MLYIAYGSNMVKHQMDRRCPNAVLVGIGDIPGYNLEFYTHATIELDFRGRASVPAVVWEISESDEVFLDRYEGYPAYYGKRQQVVNMRDGTRAEGMLYFMRAQYKEGKPTDTYCNEIIRAYVALGLTSEINTILRPAIQRGLER